MLRTTRSAAHSTSTPSASAMSTVPQTDVIARAPWRAMGTPAAAATMAAAVLMLKVLTPSMPVPLFSDDWCSGFGRDLDRVQIVNRLPGAGHLGLTFAFGPQGGQKGTLLHIGGRIVQYGGERFPRGFAGEVVFVRSAGRSMLRKICPCSCCGLSVSGCRVGPS